MTTDQLARALALIADDLDRRGYPAAGAVRQAARVLLDSATRGADACPECGAEITQPATGRRRVWCSQRCRNRAAKRTRNAKVAA